MYTNFILVSKQYLDYKLYTDLWTQSLVHVYTVRITKKKIKKTSWAHVLLTKFVWFVQRYLFFVVSTYLICHFINDKSPFHKVFHWVQSNSWPKLLRAWDFTGFMKPLQDSVQNSRSLNKMNKKKLYETDLN